jgi:hypothetical protein
MIRESLQYNAFNAYKYKILITLKTAFLLELELIQTQMAQKPMLRAEVGMRVRCANKASAE